jgi:long-chain fatty acid transport protein
MATRGITTKMTSTFKTTLMSSVAIAAAVMMTAGSANATNGYFSNGYGTTSKGMAGAGVALSQDTQAGTNNPAGMRALGDRVDVGVAVFNPIRSFSSPATGTFLKDSHQTSDTNIFVVPSFGANWDMGTYSLGVTLSANGGMNTDYATNVFSGGTNGRTGIDLAQALLGFTYSRNIGDNNTIGITPTLAGQRFMARGLQGFGSISTDAGKLTDRGYDYSYGGGLRLGWQGKVNDQLSFGAMYQSRMYMQRFQKYAGLFADKGEFDIPPSVSLGAAVKVNDKLTVAIDGQRIFYGQVEAIANSHNTTLGGIGTNAYNSLGGPDGAGFGWNDMSIGKIGVEYAYDDALTLRAGASHNTAAFSNTETFFNVLSPAVVNTHLSFGGTYNLTDSMSLSLAYTRAFRADITGVNTNHDVGYGGAALPIALDMEQNDFEIGLKMEF